MIDDDDYAGRDWFLVKLVRLTYHKRLRSLDQNRVDLAVEALSERCGQQVPRKDLAIMMGLPDHRREASGVARARRLRYNLDKVDQLMPFLSIQFNDQQPRFVIEPWRPGIVEVTNDVDLIRLYLVVSIHRQATMALRNIARVSVLERHPDRQAVDEIIAPLVRNYHNTGKEILAQVAAKAASAVNASRYPELAKALRRQWGDDEPSTDH